MEIWKLSKYIEISCLGKPVHNCCPCSPYSKDFKTYRFHRIGRIISFVRWLRVFFRIGSLVFSDFLHEVRGL